MRIRRKKRLREWAWIHREFDVKMFFLSLLLNGLTAIFWLHKCPQLLYKGVATFILHAWIFASCPYTLQHDTALYTERHLHMYSIDDIWTRGGLRASSIPIWCWKTHEDCETGYGSNLIKYCSLIQFTRSRLKTGCQCLYTDIRPFVLCSDCKERYDNIMITIAWLAGWHFPSAWPIILQCDRT